MNRFANKNNGRLAIQKPEFRSFPIAAMAIVAAIFLFDVQSVFIKLLADNYSVPQIMTFRNLFGLIPPLFVLLLSQSWIELGRPLKLIQWRLALGRGGFLVIAQFCLYFSLTRLELATATTLAFAAPVFITLLSIPVLGHRVGWMRSGAVLLGFLGVVIVMRPTAASFTWVLVLPVIAAVFYALNSITSRLFSSNIPTALISLYSALSTSVLAAILTFTVSSYEPVASAHHWVLMIMMGASGGFAVLLMITAYRMWEPSSLSPFEYLGIPFSFILGLLIFNESPIERLFPGVILIVGGGLLVIWREHALRYKLSNLAQEGE